MPTRARIFSHWHHMIEGGSMTPLEFYDAVEAVIIRRNIPGLELSRIDWREGGWFSAHRCYLRVRRQQHLFDICGAPFGTCFFISWWLGEDSSATLNLLARVPITAPFIKSAVAPGTYYKIDTALMFQQACHLSVLSVLDELTDSQGLRSLNDLERQPILREFYTA